MKDKIQFDISPSIEQAFDRIATYKAWLARYITPELLEDIQLMFGKHVKVKNLLNRSTVFSEHSEWRIPRHKISTEDYDKCSDHNNAYIGKDSASVLFVNGVLTPITVAIYQKSQLEKHMHRNVGLMYNPTHHVVADLLECYQDRNGISSEIMENTLSQIQKMLRRSDNDIVLVGYSQGAIILSAALEQLAETLAQSTLQRIHYVTFGAGFKHSILPSSIRQEHFVNSDDPVPHLGLLHPDYDVTGTIFSRECWGHLMVADYITPLVAGEFGGSSLFEGYIKGGLKHKGLVSER